MWPTARDWLVGFLFLRLGFCKWGGDAEEAEALVCKTSLSGFESRRYLQNLSGLAMVPRRAGKSAALKGEGCGIGPEFSLFVF